MQLSRKRNLFVVFFALAGFIAIYLTTNVLAKQTFWIDDKLVNLLEHVPDTLTPFFIFVTEFGDKKGIGVVALFVLVWLFVRKNFVGAAAITLAVALGNEVNKILKDLFARPRPDLEHLAAVKSYSFPSGHSMVGMIAYFFIAYLLIERISSKSGKILVASLAALLLLLIGASRIILQVHYPTDVIGGFAFGYIWVLFWIILYKYFNQRL